MSNFSHRELTARGRVLVLNVRANLDGDRDLVLPEFGRLDGVINVEVNLIGPLRRFDERD